MIIAATAFTGKSRLTKEQLAIRQRLQLRYSTANNTWEVYTTKHGSDSRNGIFRWYLVDKEVADWYVTNFPNMPVIVE